MTVELSRKLVHKWDLDQTEDPAAKSEYRFILDLLYYHATKEWRVDPPRRTSRLNPSHSERLTEWIGKAVPPRMGGLRLCA